MGLHLHIDPFSGIAGDMFLGALIDLGAPADHVHRAFAKLDVAERFELVTQRVERFGIGAVNLHVAERAVAHAGHHHDHTTAADILGMIDRLDTADRARDRARAIVRKLAEAEGRVHGKDPADVHFHEVGALDSIVDMLGAAVAMELLDIDTVSCGVLPISRGWVRCAHGLMPIPAPATAYLLEGLATQGVGREGELVTPTGAAIVAALATACGPSPAMTVAGVGYGAGDKQFPEHPNLLRLMLGRRTAAGGLGPTVPGAHNPTLAGD